MIYRRILFAMLTFFVCGAISSALHAGEFPYTATVSQKNVTARSGPTFNAYPTEQLPRGSQVEVYQDGANGWLAIRPPAEAFDWIPAPAIEKTAEKEVGKVVDEFPLKFFLNFFRSFLYLFSSPGVHEAIELCNLN